MTWVFGNYLINNKFMSNKEAIKFAIEMDMKCEKEGGYYVSMLDEIEFIPILKWLKERYNKSFLDVGSGCGDKLIMASPHFKTVKGIEICESLYNFSLQNLKRIKNYEIYNMNAFNYDYSKEEVIFMYSPILNRSLLRKLYQTIINDMSPGTILIDSNPCFDFPYKQFPTKHMGSCDRYAGYYVKS